MPNRSALLALAGLRLILVHDLGTAAVLLKDWHVLLVDDEVDQEELKAISDEAFDRMAASLCEATPSPGPAR